MTKAERAIRLADIVVRLDEKGIDEPDLRKAREGYYLALDAYRNAPPAKAVEGVSHGIGKVDHCELGPVWDLNVIVIGDRPDIEPDTRLRIEVLDD